MWKPSESQANRIDTGEEVADFAGSSRKKVWLEGVIRRWKGKKILA